MRRGKGFTLIELLAVILIIGILVAIALPQYKRMVTKTRVMSLMPLLRSISEAEGMYFLQNGKYTLDFSELDTSMPSGAVVETSSSVRYKGFYCYLRCAENGSLASYSAYCNRLESESPQLEKYFSRQAFICWGGSAEKDRLCQDISGLTESNASSGSTPGYSF